MKPYQVIYIPATIPEQQNQHLGTPGKTHVVGYAQVIKGTGAGVQIRKNIRHLIKDLPNWELTFVTTDYRETESLRSFFCVWCGLRDKYIDVLIIHSANDLDNAFKYFDYFRDSCKDFGAKLYIAHNDVLLSEGDFPL